VKNKKESEMKKKLLLAAIILLMPMEASAGLIDHLGMMAATAGQETRKTEAYKLNVIGFNVRVYEWTPKSSKTTRCVLVAGADNSTGVACYKIGS